MKDLYPFIRVNRGISSLLIYPEHPIQALAFSEVVSVIGPFLTPKMYKKIYGLILAIMYVPSFSHHLITSYNKQFIIYNQAEICCILLFILTFALDYLH